MLENTPQSELPLPFQAQSLHVHCPEYLLRRRLGVTLNGLQRTADLVSTYAVAFNSSIASNKLQALHFG